MPVAARKPLMRLTLHGRIRYPLCGGCRWRAMQPIGFGQVAPVALRRSRTHELYGEELVVLGGPDIDSDASPSELQASWSERCSDQTGPVGLSPVPQN